MERMIKMGLGELRGQINDIDAQILSLFEKRMEVCYKVAEYKMDNGLEVSAVFRFGRPTAV